MRSNTLTRVSNNPGAVQNYQGKEPAASYQILINNVPVSPRSTSENLAEASFRNTLSGGTNRPWRWRCSWRSSTPIRNWARPSRCWTIRSQAPITSGGSRRQFTAIEIRKLCGRAAQTVVLSHDKYFLRLLWERIDQSTIKCVAIQAGAPGITTIAPYDVEIGDAAPAYHRAHENRGIRQGSRVRQSHEAGYIRTRLRTVCEAFYRRGFPVVVPRGSRA